MKTRFLEQVRFLRLLCWAVLMLGLRASAQSERVLDIQLYTGLSITGVVGTVCSVEYVTDLTPANDWRCLTFLQLAATNYLWFDPTVPATGRRFYRAVEFAAPTNLVFIPPGTFRMGIPTSEVDGWYTEGPQTAVTISRGFWMGRYEVTQGEYLKLMGSNPSRFNGDRTVDWGTNYGTDLSRPVEQVRWLDATNYCSQLTQRERSAGRIEANNEYRLPTEAEWEYACRAWTSTRFSYGDDPGYTNLTNYAWYGESDSRGTTHPVGQKLPNAWGLYDMQGNVEELCKDWAAIYPGGIALDLQGPATGSGRAVRGGGWDGLAWRCRSAARSSIDLDARGYSIGFRVVLAPGQP